HECCRDVTRHSLSIRRAGAGSDDRHARVPENDVDVAHYPHGHRRILERQERLWIISIAVDNTASAHARCLLETRTRRSACRLEGAGRKRPINRLPDGPNYCEVAADRRRSEPLDHRQRYDVEAVEL